MVDIEKIAKHIAELEKYTQRLDELKSIKKKDFLTDWHSYDLVERELHLALETFLTLGEMLISECKLKKPDTYAEIPKILAENNVIPSDLGDQLIVLARFLNVLVHDYLYLDHDKVYDNFLKIPDILQQYLVFIKSFLKTHST